MGPSRRDELILYTGGTFDCYHAGHANFLRQCRQLVGPDGTVIVSLNTDAFVSSYKGKAPVISYPERKAVLESVKYVDKVIPNTGGPDSKVAILGVGPDIVAIDTGWVAEDYYGQMDFTQEWLDQQGIVLVYLPRAKGISTTEIRERLAPPDPGRVIRKG